MAVGVCAGCGKAPPQAVAKPDAQDDLSMWAASFKGGKGDAGGWAPLRDRRTGRVIYVYVHNLNCRQNLGGLAAFSPHFASQEELEMFAFVYLQRDKCWRMESHYFDPDPEGRYEYAEPGAWEKEVEVLSGSGRMDGLLLLTGER